MSNHQKEVKLKANIAELVGPLLKRLKLTQEQFPKNSEIEQIIDQISTEVVKRKDVIDRREKWDRDLTGYFGKIERHIDWIDHNNRNTEWNEHTLKTNLMDVLNQLSQNESVNPSRTGNKPHEKASELPKKATITEVGESSNRSYEDNNVFVALECVESLGLQAMSCLYSLGIFPENKELKKSSLIYWWIGLGLVPFWTTASGTIERGEIFFSYLVHKGILVPVPIREHKPVTNRWTIQPTIHKQLINVCGMEDLISNEKTEEGTWQLYKYDALNQKVLLNLDQSYLNSKDISSKHDMQVVLLGNWRHHSKTEVYNKVEETECEETKSKDHIEVDEIDFLKKFGEKVTYLSLQGISRIEELHESIGELQNLMILDLNACHNLEKLPQISRSILKPKYIRRALPQEKWFKKLTVLDISECYLLDYMPKWICDLSNLEVLKGFVVGSVRTKKQSCRLGDISKLNKLRKLSIRIIASTHLVPKDFEDFKSLDRLLVLTIIWGGNKSDYKIPTYSLPRNLEKLDIRCYPEVEASKLLNPAELTNLKRLYIRGGNLTKIPCNTNWEVEILRLRFLKDLVYPTDWNELRRSFKNLKYVEYVQCPMPENFPNDGCSWSMEKDEPSQWDNATETSNGGILKRR